MYIYFFREVEYVFVCKYIKNIIQSQADEYQSGVSVAKKPHTHGLQSCHCSVAFQLRPGMG